MWPFNKIEWSLLLLAWLAVGCSVINQYEKPPSDWPELKQIIYKIGYWKLQKICGRDGIFYGCTGYAIIDFDSMTCTIYYTGDGKWGQRSLEHEKDHCKGKDHIRSKTLAKHWEDHKIKINFKANK